MCGEHAVDVAVQRAGGRLVVARLHEPEVDAAVHQALDDQAVVVVAADTVPAQADDASVLAIPQQLAEPLKFWPFDCEGHAPVVGHLEIGRHPAGVLLLNDAAFGKARFRATRNLEAVTTCVSQAFVDLVREGVFLVVCIVGALAGVDEVFVLFGSHRLE